MGQQKLKQCPASLFYQTLILLFSPNPVFLVEAHNYLKPVLYLKDTEIKFH